jgi:hypothetical protein
VELTVRAELIRHFDVVVVIWALALMVGFIVAGLTHSELTPDQWSFAQTGPHWIVPGQP